MNQKKQSGKMFWLVLVFIVLNLLISNEAQADEYLGTDWWLKVSTENASWLNGSFSVSGYDRWGNYFSHTGNRIEIGRGPQLGVFYVTGSTRLTLADQNFGANFYPVPMSSTATPIPNGGNIRVATNGDNHLSLIINPIPSLGLGYTYIIFDGVSKAYVFDATSTMLTASLQNDSCSENMNGYMVDGARSDIPPTSQTVKESFECQSVFGIMGGGSLNAPSIFIRVPSGSRSGSFQKDPSINRSDDNVYLELDQPVSDYIVEASNYCAKLNSDLSISLPCVDVGGVFYDIRFTYASQIGSYLWQLAEYKLAANNYNCATVNSVAQIFIPCVNVAQGVNCSVGFNYYPVDASGLFWQLSSVVADRCNPK